MHRSFGLGCDMYVILDANNPILHSVHNFCELKTWRALRDIETSRKQDQNVVDQVDSAAAVSRATSAVSSQSPAAAPRR